MSAADKEKIRRKRLENYQILHQNLMSCQKLQFVQDLNEAASPQCYPLLVEANIRDSLIAEKIFVPLMWRRHLNGEFVGTTEQSMAKYLLCLPIDQRYSTLDMQYIADTVKMLLN